MGNPLEGFLGLGGDFLGTLGDTVGKAVVSALLPVIEPKLNALVEEVSSRVKADVEELLKVARTDLGSALGDLGNTLKGDL